jgi:hypothetical protein
VATLSVIVLEDPQRDAGNILVGTEPVDDLSGSLAIVLGDAQEHHGLEDLLDDLGWNETRGLCRYSIVSILLLGQRVCARTSGLHHARRLASGGARVVVELRRRGAAIRGVCGRHGPSFSGGCYLFVM